MCWLVRAQLIEDKTFGLKNKNKSKSVQVRKYVPRLISPIYIHTYIVMCSRDRLLVRYVHSISPIFIRTYVRYHVFHVIVCWST